MQNQAILSPKRVSLFQLISSTLMVAGTTIGAGMLGMPLVTAKAGFFPAVGITTAVWLFMLCTGLLLIEVCAKMPKGSNFLSLSEHYLGVKGKVGVGALFAFLYYALLVAYFAVGSLLVSSLFDLSTNTALITFSAVFATVVASGPRWIGRINSFLTIAMFLAYALLITIGSSAVSVSKLSYSNIKVCFLATPVLFSAFGYHNIIPSLTTYLDGQKKMLRISVIAGTMIALAVFLLWQWMIIGSIPQEILAKTLSDGLPVTQALQVYTGRLEIYRIGQCFAFFALTTSLLGVCFSMVDFLAEAVSVSARGMRRVLLTLLTFLPPVLCVFWNPSIFDKALGFAGGVGEAFLNGFVPIAFFVIMKKRFDKEKMQIKNKLLLALLSLFCLFVFCIEIHELIF